jgi:heme-degrading monooxygenase HmoA
MIARVWHGVTQLAHANEYLRLMREVALVDYKRIPGNVGAFVLRRLEEDCAHFLNVSLWESRDAIVAYAGEPIETAKYYEFDKDYLIVMEPRVTHHEIFWQHINDRSHGYISGL